MLPAAWLVGRAAFDALGAEPVEELINRTGTWGIRIFVTALAVSPLRRLYNWPALMTVRRMVGLVAFFYLATHFALYGWSQALDIPKIASEIVRRLYLTIGFTALLGLAALAATSTDAAIRKLGGRRWKQLHRIVYLAAILGIVHHWMQARLQDYLDPLFLSGILVWLAALRWATPRSGPIPPLRALLLAISCVVLTALGEALYLNLWVGADMLAVLVANITGAAGTRPAWIAAAVVLPLAGAAFVQRLMRPRIVPT
jgi:sulfoxide reductase heme-binding subunit YedZ